LPIGQKPLGLPLALFLLCCATAKDWGIYFHSVEYISVGTIHWEKVTGLSLLLLLHRRYHFGTCVFKKIYFNSILFSGLFPGDFGGPLMCSCFFSEPYRKRRDKRERKLFSSSRNQMGFVLQPIGRDRVARHFKRKKSMRPSNTGKCLFFKFFF
jgi:hypothetical protein